MNRSEVIDRIHGIEEAARQRDHELAHSREDQLVQDIIDEIVVISLHGDLDPAQKVLRMRQMAREAQYVRKIEFERWMA